MFDEAYCIALGSGLFAQPVLKWCQWTDPARHFDQDTPCNTGEMQPGKFAKAQYQQAAGDNEQDKCGMQDKNQVNQEIDSQPSSLPNENLSTR